MNFVYTSEELQLLLLAISSRMAGTMKAFLLMFLVQAAFAGNNILYKIVIFDGMPVSIITVYRQMISAAFTLSLAFIFERNDMPKLTFKLLSISFLNGLLGGSLYQNLYFESLSLISATFVTALFNLIPAITFALAILFGLETLDFHTISCKVKVMGTIIGIGGAMFVTFLKSVELSIWPFHFNILNKKQTEIHSGSKVLGICFGFLSCILFSFWLIFQGKMSKNKTYPKHYTSMALMSMMAALQSTAYALCVERNWSQWRLGWDLRLLTVVFSGTMGTGFANVVIAWSVRKKGPLFAALFSPVELILVVIVCSIMLDEPLYLGSLIGGVLIVVGLYMVLWGQNKEIQMATQLENEHIEVANTMGTWRSLEGGAT